jgi:hypothetical protein
MAPPVAAGHSGYAGRADPWRREPAAHRLPRMDRGRQGLRGVPGGGARLRRRRRVPRDRSWRARRWRRDPGRSLRAGDRAAIGVLAPRGLRAPRPRV